MQKRIEEIQDVLGVRAKEVEAALEACFAEKDADIASLLESEAYSLFAGGKRIRPFLVNEICRMLGGDATSSMAYACALEMIHTYSLIHDDLPCMDDDDLRRGRPTNHKVFGYATALLAGDALLTHAFLTASQNPHMPPAANAEAVAMLSSFAGEFGMIGGQIMDLAGENEQLDLPRLLKLHSMKTGALMECAARLGALAAGFSKDTKESEAVTEYARKLGLAFQVIDDILDVEGNEADLGKPIGSDADRNKTTFMSYYTPSEAREYAARLTAEAVGAIADMPGSVLLSDLAVYLLERTH